MSFSWSTSRRTAVCLLAAGVSSCATYRDRTDAALRDFQAGRFSQAEEEFGDPGATTSEFLAGAEAGTVALTDGRWEEAIRWFDRAGACVAELEAQVLQDPGSSAGGLGGLLPHDSLSTYRGEGYERATLHVVRGLAHLGLGALEDTLLEVQRSKRLLAAEGARYDKEYRKAGLTHFISAIGHEIRGEHDQAWADWSALEERGLAPSVHRPALQRCAARLARMEDFERLVARDGQAAALPEGAVRIVLVAGVGRGPVKVGSRQEVLTPEGAVTLTVPRFARRPQPVEHLEMIVTGVAVRSVEIEAVHALAQESLADRLSQFPERTSTDEQGHGWEAALGGVGHSVGGLTNATWEEGAVERTADPDLDLRSWKTLPDSWHVASIFAPPGRHAIAVSIPDAVTADLGSIILEPGETVFVLARSLDDDLHVRRVGGLEVALPVEIGPLDAR